MGTKNKPGEFDCYANAEPDEPMFILLARDPLAPLLVSLWAKMRQKLDYGEDKLKIDEAINCVGEMRLWMTLNRPNKNYEFAENAFSSVIVEESIAIAFDTSASIL